jgi:hypothetical protein
MSTLPFIGVGFLIANDILTDASFRLVEPVVNMAFYDNTMAGSRVILSWDPSLYVGAQLVAGVLGVTAEVVTVTAINPGVSFTATFQNNHQGAEPIVGATFPVQNSAGDPYFTQAEMLQYLSDSVNDFLLACPLVYQVTAGVTYGPTQQIAALPGDCMYPVRVAYAGRALRETSQSNLDGTDYRWNSAALATPKVYYRDKIGVQNLGIWPRQANTVNTEIVYAQRGPEVMGLADGFLLPDPFLVTIKHRLFERCYSKDGEQRSPALAKVYGMKYAMGVKVANMILNLVMAPDTGSAS